jgi:hypothetical protein
MRGSMSPRLFIGIISAVLAIVGAFALLASISITRGDPIYGQRYGECGSAFAPDPRVEEGSVCAEEITDRRIWAWPSVIFGIVGVAGAYLIRTARDTDRHAWETDDIASPRPSSVSNFQVGDCVEVIAGPRLGDYGTIAPAHFKLKEGYVCVELASDGTRQYMHSSRLAPLDDVGTDEPIG